ncbi:MAG: hypothetical protein HUU20_09490 [Pirellulales bacterium]|nr:hypothetical protein [Pirellulales bacterium]
MTRSTRFIACITLFAAVLVAPGHTLGTAQGEEANALRQDFDQLVRELDADQFVVRKVAALKLDKLASRPESSIPLAEEVRRVLLRPDLSFEVRTRLEQLARTLPKTTGPHAAATSEEVDRLINQLESDSYAERLGATRRLQWLLDSPDLVCPVMIRLKNRCLQDELSPDARQWIEPIDRQARAAWLSSDPAKWQLPPVTDVQIAAWIDDLAQAGPDDEAARRALRKTAERELLDLLARDDYVPKVKQALEAKLAGEGVDPAGESRLREILDLTPPAMVAEFWTDRQHLGTQYLVVGVPSLGPGAERPSHFDRIDDHVAHCVSGNSLTPGDYPVGVAVPHPSRENAIFHLVNLPTPRRRMAYEYHRQSDATARLTEITRRTAERFLSRKQHLTEAELVMLPQLDLDLASAFAAKMLQVLEDKRLPEEGPQRTGGRPSHHGMLCAFLAAEGTKAGAAALLEAIPAGRVLLPTAAAPYRLDWLAALSIAVADPWPEAETWLAGLIERTDPLILNQTDPPELGATAAAVLIDHHEQPLSAFGLEFSADRVLDLFGIRGCRFRSSEARGSVHRWWVEQNKAAKLSAEASP